MLLSEQLGALQSHIHDINITSSAGGAHTHTITAFTVAAVTASAGDHFHSIDYTEGTANGSGLSYESS